jgi:lysophospholipase L1-like esterase
MFYKPIDKTSGILRNHADYWALFENNYIGNLGLVIEYIKSKNSSIEIYLVTPPYRYATGWTDKSVSRIIPIIQSVADFYSIPVINAMQRSGVSYKDMKANFRYSYDGVHLNTLGNEVWGRYIGLSVLAGN